MYMTRRALGRPCVDHLNEAISRVRFRYDRWIPAFFSDLKSSMSLIFESDRSAKMLLSHSKRTWASKSRKSTTHIFIMRCISLDPGRLTRSSTPLRLRLLLFSSEDKLGDRNQLIWFLSRTTVFVQRFCHTLASVHAADASGTYAKLRRASKSWIIPAGALRSTKRKEELCLSW